MQALTTAQYTALITAIRKGGKGFRPNPRVAAALTIEGNLGLRIGDVLRLKMSDIVRGTTGYRLNIIEQKTGKKRRFSVPDEVYSFLRDYCTTYGIEDDEQMFPITVRMVQSHLKKVCEALGYTNVSTHSFRKWCATDIYNATHDIVLVQHLLQHSSAAITQRYIGIDDEKVNQAIGKHALIA